MSATVANDSLPDPQQPAAAAPPVPSPPHPAAETEPVACACCGLVEECTQEYIARVRERYGGRWICGLCAEAVKDEILRAGRLIALEDAISRHMAFCVGSRHMAVGNPTAQLISAVRQLLRRSLDSPRVRTSPNSPRGDEDVPRRALARSASCIPELGEE